MRAQKQRLRKSISDRLEIILKEKSKSQLDFEIQKSIQSLITKPNTQVASFQPLPLEPDPNFTECGISPIHWAYPRVEGEEISFYRTSEGTHWVYGPWGLKEPDPSSSEKIFVEDMDFVFVPGVAFDRSGHRLGHGKGYYDRALAKYKGIKVGVAYSAQVEEDLPSEPHDIVMDLIVTEKYILQPLFNLNQSES